MTARVGDYVKVTFDFPGSEKSDLPLSQGDFIRITSVVDENWAVGEKIGFENMSGTFPLTFVESVSVPSTHDSQKLFLALEDFPAEQKGDLEFRKGDIILGLEKLDNLWWKGQNNSRTGLFPLSIVAELSCKNTNQQRPYNKSCLSSCLKDIQSEVEPCIHVERGNEIKEVTFAKALMDVTPHFNGELAFSEGDTIAITKIVDSDWFYGNLGLKKGLVLAENVQVLIDCHKCTPSNYSHSKVVLSTNEDSHGSLSKCTSHDNAESFKSESFEHKPINSVMETNVHKTEAAPCGLVKHIYTSKNPSELFLPENSSVSVIKNIDPVWTEDEVKGETGIFATSCMEIVVDCPNICNPDGKENWSFEDLKENESSLDVKRNQSFPDLRDNHFINLKRNHFPDLKKSQPSPEIKGSQSCPKLKECNLSSDLKEKVSSDVNKNQPSSKQYS